MFCAVTITNVLPKDNGEWHFTVGTGENLQDFEKDQFVHQVSVTGNKSILNSTPNLH